MVFVSRTIVNIIIIALEADFDDRHGHGEDNEKVPVMVSTMRMTVNSGILI